VAFGRGEVLDAIEQLGVAVGTHLGVTELAGVAPRHFAAQLHGHGLHAVADAQHRHAGVPHGLRRTQLVVFVGAGVAARQDDALGAEGLDELVRHVVGVDLAVDVGFAHAAGDQLGDLGAKVEDQDLVMHGGISGNQSDAMWMRIVRGPGLQAWARPARAASCAWRVRLK